MTIKEAILGTSNKKKLFNTADVLVALHYKVSRQAVALELKKMLDDGVLIKLGSTRGAKYSLVKHADSVGLKILKTLQNKNLEEHEIFKDIQNRALFISNAPENIFSIIQYAFDEMLNNAIDHSKSKVILVSAQKNKTDISFDIQDFGIGAFRNIMEKRKLKSELEAIQDLLKGKTTTAPKAHSGEGIFFTSKAVDTFIIESFGWRLRVDNTIPDIFIEETKPIIKGTKVTCTISINSNRHLIDVFKKYESKSEEMDFGKTEVHIRLFTMGTIYVSRSQARRVLNGLEKFKAVIMDFDRVPTVGQAFADEVFRVFKIQHPEIKILPINMNKAVEFMVRRVGSAE